MRVVVTRPEREARQWAQALASHGFEPLLLPLIHIAPEPDAQPLLRAWDELALYRAAMFVSTNAVAGFFASKWPPAQAGRSPLAINTRAWAPGPGTAAALREHGWPVDRIDAPPTESAQFDSEALWQVVAAQVQGQPGARVLLVRGGDAQGRPAGRDWLAQQLAAEGVLVDRVQAYRRQPPGWQADEAALAARAAADGSVWLFSSSEAIANLLAALPGQDWRQARAVATHPRIAQAARDAGFGAVVGSQPAVDAVVASIESLR